jgi:hypothetical protein
LGRSPGSRAPPRPLPAIRTVPARSPPASRPAAAALQAAHHDSGQRPLPPAASSPVSPFPTASTVTDTGAGQVQVAVALRVSTAAVAPAHTLLLDRHPAGPTADSRSGPVKPRRSTRPAPTRSRRARFTSRRVRR